MKAGSSNLDIGTIIKITKVVNKERQYLVGHTGVLTHPFPYFNVAFVGVYLDLPDKYMSYICNLSAEDEIELIG